MVLHGHVAGELRNRERVYPPDGHATPGQLWGHRVETVVQVLTETSRLDRLEQVVVRGGNQHAHRSSAPWPNLRAGISRLQHAQQDAPVSTRAARQTSSRNIVPPSASSKYPLRASVAPVKAPFSCPKSSESIVPSGMAPQFTAIYLACLRAEYACIICGKNSFPTPLSPTTSTDRSVGATRRATLKARFSSSELPIIPKRCFNRMLCQYSQPS